MIEQVGYERLTATDFRLKISAITQAKQPVVITSHNRVMGVYVPLKSVDNEDAIVSASIAKVQEIFGDGDEEQS